LPGGLRKAGRRADAAFVACHSFRARPLTIGIANVRSHGRGRSMCVSARGHPGERVALPPLTIRQTASVPWLGEGRASDAVCALIHPIDA
jgi:hypothetical protein